MSLAELVAVKTDEEATRLRFPGSPTRRVDDKDLFPFRPNGHLTVTLASVTYSNITVTDLTPMLRGEIRSRLCSTYREARQSPERLEALLEVLDSSTFAGHPDLRWPLPPSTSPEEPGFPSRLLARPDLAGHQLASVVVTPAGGRGGACRTSATYILRATCEGGVEYFDPYTGEPPWDRLASPGPPPLT